MTLTTSNAQASPRFGTTDRYLYIFLCWSSKSQDVDPKLLAFDLLCNFDVFAVPTTDSAFYNPTSL